MHRLEALRILEAKLAMIEEEYHVEIAENDELHEPIDAKAEARALAAVFDFLQNSKIAPTDSLLRIFERYLRPKTRSCMTIAGRQRPPSRGRNKGQG
jgi:hypothetical protein